jgi:hypothetical protein
MELVLVKLHARQNEAVRLQEILTRHGCDIALRLGLHEVSDQACSEEGLILLQLKPKSKVVKSLVADLKTVGRISVKTVSM